MYYASSRRRVQSDVTELTWITFWRTDQWASSNTLQLAPSYGVGGLRDYAHVRVNQWPVNSLCLPSCQFVKN